MFYSYALVSPPVPLSYALVSPPVPLSCAFVIPPKPLSCVLAIPPYILVIRGARRRRICCPRLVPARSRSLLVPLSFRGAKRRGICCFFGTPADFSLRSK